MGRSNEAAFGQFGRAQQYTGKQVRFSVLAQPDGGAFLNHADASGDRSSRVTCHER